MDIKFTTKIDKHHKLARSTIVHSAGMQAV